ncbi:hypothetical protein [uncultured Parabacteroides sp.]|uniref:hypothetical protein n=1 Tax=uncultured Parabacteroides sp. TaxID=512312 RepID=UPI002591FD3E|nr:hypothetical protein [uncultured Parabacteroides sp.]
MSTLASNPRIRKMIHSISEIWFIIILSFPAWSMTSYLIVKEFDNFTFVLTLFFTIAIGLLIKQLFQKTGWISSLLGFLLSLASLYMIGALLSEYGEFPTGAEPNAIKMIIIGGTLVGTSLILALKMWYQGVLNMLAS